MGHQHSSQTPTCQAPIHNRLHTAALAKGPGNAIRPQVGPQNCGAQIMCSSRPRGVVHPSFPHFFFSHCIFWAKEEPDHTSDKTTKQALPVVSKLFQKSPYCDDLPEVKFIVVDLCNKDGCKGLVQSSAIHVNCSSHRQNKPRDAPVHTIIFFQAPEGDG